jgi:hypothetical protein
MRKNQYAEFDFRPFNLKLGGAQSEVVKMLLPGIRRTAT